MRAPKIGFTLCCVVLMATCTSAHDASSPDLLRFVAEWRRTHSCDSLHWLAGHWLTVGMQRGAVESKLGEGGEPFIEPDDPNVRMYAAQSDELAENYLILRYSRGVLDSFEFVSE